MKEIKGYNKRYLVTRDGKVWSNIRGRYLTIQKDRQGYPRIMLTNKDGKLKYWCVHRLVASSFLPNPLVKPEINHKNGIKTDNRVENLEWCTHGENMRHAERNGLRKAAFGEGHGMSKLSTDQVAKVRRICKETTRTYKDIAQEFGVHLSLISLIKRNKIRCHG